MHSAEEAFSYAEVAAVCTRIDAGLVKNITYRSERGGALLKPAKEIKKNIKIEAIKRGFFAYFFWRKGEVFFPHKTFKSESRHIPLQT